MTDTTAPIVQLSMRQLEAYNNNDIDAFCACYHPEIVVLNADGKPTTEGMEAFRKAYGGLFERFKVQATVTERLVLGPHVVERELWQRDERDGDLHQNGEVLVRYTLRDGLIGTAQFLFP